MYPSTTANVSKTILPNGLTVLVKENHTAPVAAALAHVNVGYFNEPDRWNGIAHVVEHMFFKGTRNRPAREQIAEEIRALGGSINAGTYYDETSYYTVLPSAGLEKAIEIQADSFQNSLFDGEELAKELEVIIQESRQKKDNPSSMLLETMYAQAFDHHRIRRWRIGPDEILRSLRHDDLAQFVAQTYRPENIVLTIVGDVETCTALDWVRRYWEEMPRGELVREVSPAEPRHAEFRFGRMRGDIQQRLIEFGFHAPHLLHPDAAPLMALGTLLSDGRSSRLYRRLKEEQRLVSAAWAGYEGFEDIGIFTLGADTLSDDPIEAERGLLAEVERITGEGAGEDELRRVKTRMESRRLFGQEEVLGVARHLASYQSLGDYRMADEMLERLQSVTTEDVQRVAAEYVRLEGATLQEYLPTGAGAPERTVYEMRGLLGGSAAPDSVTHSGGPNPARAAESDAVEEITLAAGATLLFRRRTDLPIVALHILLPGGRLGETPATAGITSLMLKSMLKGTQSLTALEIAEGIEGLGSGIGTSAAPDYIGFSMKILASRLPEGLAILRDVLRFPTFPPDEVEKEKQSLYAEIRRQQDSMSSRTIDLFNAACWGGQPYGLPASGVAEAIERFTPADLRLWHESWIGGERAIIGVVGDVESQALTELLEDLLPTMFARAPLPVEFVPEPPGERAVSVEKQQTASVMGFPGARMGEEPRHALDLIAEITSGLAGRFFQAVRGENALAYAVTSFHRARRLGGSFATYTATSPGNEHEARDILLAECRRLKDQPVSDKELLAGKTAIRGERVTGLQSFSAQAGELAIHRLYGLPLGAGERYVARVEAVTPEELRAVAREYLREDQMWIGAVRGLAE